MVHKVDEEKQDSVKDINLNININEEFSLQNYPRVPDLSDVEMNDCNNSLDLCNNNNNNNNNNHHLQINNNNQSNNGNFKSDKLKRDASQNGYSDEGKRNEEEDN